MKTKIRVKRLGFVLLTVTNLLMTGRGLCQDMEPRRWTPLPLGTHILGVGYSNSFGEIFFDPLLQAEDVTVNVNTVAVSYVQPFQLAHKLARIDVMLPFSIAHWEGLLSGAPTSIDRNGFADPRIRLSLNLLGMPPGGGAELREYLQAHPIHTSLGVSLAVTLPIGQYFDEKLLNLGQNRFVFYPQLGIVHSWGNWAFEFTTGAFFYTNNSNFAGGKERKQKATLALQTHLIKSFKGRYWVSVSAGYGLGGQSIVNRVPNADERADLGGAFSFGFPLFKNQAMKIVYIRSETLRDIGANTNTLALAWNMVF